MILVSLLKGAPCVMMFGDVVRVYAKAYICKKMKMMILLMEGVVEEMWLMKDGCEGSRCEVEIILTHRCDVEYPQHTGAISEPRLKISKNVDLFRKAEKPKGQASVLLWSFHCFGRMVEVYARDIVFTMSFGFGHTTQGICPSRL